MKKRNDILSDKPIGLCIGVAMLALALGIGAMQASTFAAAPISLGQGPPQPPAASRVSPNLAPMTSGYATRPGSPVQPFGAMAAGLLTGDWAQAQSLHRLASTYTVNSTADTDDGLCTTDPGGCTLREAINAANNNSGVLDTINF